MSIIVLVRNIAANKLFVVSYSYSSFEEFKKTKESMAWWNNYEFIACITEQDDKFKAAQQIIYDRNYQDQGIIEAAIDEGLFFDHMLKSNKKVAVAAMPAKKKMPEVCVEAHRTKPYNPEEVWKAVIASCKGGANRQH